jgi:hypothetical protein
MQGTVSYLGCQYNFMVNRSVFFLILTIYSASWKVFL